MAIGRCREAGFTGEMIAVHPTRATLAGVRCVPSVADLPFVPDAAYVGVNRGATIEVVRALAAMGAGGCVCYAAGFSEVGGDGIDLQRQLVEAAAQMPLVGPNCFGLVNYLDGCALWPYLFGGSRTTRGVALISQSGNVAMNLTMNQRSVRFTHVICGGNQAVLGPHDYLAALLDDDRVRVVAMVLEGLTDVGAFARETRRALEQGVPIVVVKVGRTAAGAERASSHTSSLTGSDILYDAFFERLGIIRVDTLNALLETAKFLDIQGALPGNRIITLSCSGGEAGILADLTATHGLETPPFSEEQTRALYDLFPGYVTVSNPFDYNTSIWGDKPGMRRCFALSMGGAHDVAMLVYDHPTVVAPEVDEWLDAIDAFIGAHEDTGMAAVVACTVSELLPGELRERLIAHGIAPLQGLDEALVAVAAAARYGRQRAARGGVPLPRTESGMAAGGKLIDEWQGKRLLQKHGLSVPQGCLCASGDEAARAATGLGFPVVLKACGPGFEHKSELGAVRLGLRDETAVRDAAGLIRVAAAQHGLMAGSFLVERMVPAPVAEVIVGVHRDALFGLTLVLGSGGVLVELVADAVSLLLPVDRPMVSAALRRLKVARLMDGFRGRPAGDFEATVDAIIAIARFAETHWDTLVELDVNPLIVGPAGQGAHAVDALIRLLD